MKQAGFFDVDERLRRVSDLGDPLEVMATIIDFEGLRAVLDRALARSDLAKGGRPPFDPVFGGETGPFPFPDPPHCLRS